MPPRRTVVVSRVMLIVCRAETTPALNESLAMVDTSGATDILNVKLRLALDPTNAVAAHYTRWGMDSTQESELRQVFAQQGWRPLRGSEGTVLEPSDPVPSWTLSDQRWWVWNGATTSDEHALTSLGLALMPSPPD